AALPLRAVDNAGAGFHVVRAEHDEDVVDGALPDRLDDGLEQDVLLWGPEPARSAGREYDRPNPGVSHPPRRPLCGAAAWPIRPCRPCLGAGWPAPDRPGSRDATGSARLPPARD